MTGSQVKAGEVDLVARFYASGGGFIGCTLRPPGVVPQGTPAYPTVSASDRRAVDQMAPLPPPASTHQIRKPRAADAMAPPSTSTQMFRSTK
jgi:hypothetical protein